MEKFKGQGRELTRLSARTVDAVWRIHRLSRHGNHFEGIDTYDKVEKCFLEGDGHFSIIPKQKDPGGGNEKKKERCIV